MPRRASLHAVAIAATALLTACAEKAVAPIPDRSLAPGKAHLDASLAAPVRFAGNGHYYEAISSHLNFFPAKAAAAARQFRDCTSAHLATITSAEEDAFVAVVFNGPGAWWVGGFQPAGSPEPAGNWQWITGEPFVYTNWRNSGEPNNSGGFENAMYMNSQTGAFVDFDENRGFDLEGYIVEYEGCDHFVSDTFDGNTIDPTKWTVVTSPIPGGNPNASQHDGAIFLTDRVHLHTAQQYNARGGVHITGEWTIVGGAEDVLQILTRSSGVPAGQFGETSFGVGFANWSDVSEAHNAFGIGGDNFTVAGSLVFHAGVTYLFDITDDGFNLTFTLTNKSNPSETKTGHATSTFQAPLNYVTFHNRENCCDGTHTAKLDNIVIDQLPIHNAPPAANAGGPYTVAINSPVTLNASGSSDPDGDALTYAWDLDTDGSYETSGVAPTTTFTSLGTKTVGLKVTDAFGASSTTTTTVNVIDPTPPSITPNVGTPNGANGWFVTSPVAVSFTVSEPESPGSLQTTGCGTTSVSTDTQGQTITCSATSAGGQNSSTVTVKLDATKPVVGFSGAQTTYTVDQTINITCSASDATSGLASNTCANISGPAYNFALGAHPYSASATDNAGNSNSASGSFTVVANTSSISNLISSFVSGQSAAQLLNRMKNIDDKLGKNSPSLDEQIKNFLKELDKAQQKGDVSAANAAILAALVQSLN